MASKQSEAVSKLYQSWLTIPTQDHPRPTRPLRRFAEWVRPKLGLTDHARAA
jgi:hypothetical protein